MNELRVSSECEQYLCNRCNALHCECSCHYFPHDEDGERIVLEPCQDEAGPMRGIANGLLFGALIWAGIFIAAWLIWKAAHYA